MNSLSGVSIRFMNEEVITIRDVVSGELLASAPIAAGVQLYEFVRDKIAFYAGLREATVEESRERAAAES